MDFIKKPMGPEDAAKAGLINTNNWDELLQLHEVSTFNAETLKTINTKSQAETTADDVIDWKEIVNTAARHFPEYIDSEKAKDWNAVMHFAIGVSEEKMGKFTLKIENGVASYTDGLSGEPTSETEMDAKTFISTITHTDDLELSDSELEGIAGGGNKLSTTVTMCMGNTDANVCSMETTCPSALSTWEPMVPNRYGSG